MGSFVSRPDDLQTLSLPLSLVAMTGYLIAVLVLGGGGGTVLLLASFVPPFSPFVMLARLMVSAVQPWELVLSIGLLLAAIAVVAVVATRMYAAGVLLYGQRPGLRAFVAAARRGLIRRREAVPRQTSSNGNRLMSARTGAAAAPGTSSSPSGSAGAAGHRRRRHVAPEPAADAGQVRTRPLPGEDPRDPLGDRRLEQGDALRRDGRHRDHLVARPQHLAEQLPPADQRL